MKRTFRVNIVFSFSFLLLATGLSIAVFSYMKNKATILDFVHGSFEQAAVNVMDKTANYMKASQILTEVSVRVLDGGDVHMGLGTALEGYLQEVVHAQKQIDLFYFGDEQGNFLQAVNVAGKSYSKYIDRSGGGARKTVRYYDGAMQAVRDEHSDNEPYDPRVRPWYKGAKATGSAYWTDPYVFFDTGQPGITVASPVYRTDHGLKGVVASDITLDGLSRFLRNIDLSEHGIAFIFSAGGELIAFPDPKKMVTMENGQMRTLRVPELGIPYITSAIRHYEDQPQSLFQYQQDGQGYLAYFAPFPKEFGKHWRIAIIAPEDDYLGPMKETLQLSLGISALVLLGAVFVGLVLARQLSHPIEQLTEEVLKVKDFNLEAGAPVVSPIREIRSMETAIAAMKNGLRAFRRYVPATLVKQLIDSGEDVTIGGKERELTLMFTDIKGFTGISESIPPRDLMIRLSEYFDRVGRVIDEHRGTVDKFIGDAVMAFWGAPVINDDHAVDACRTALACREAIETLNRQWMEEGKEPFETRIGVHTGYAIVGNLGSSERMNYSVIGDTVNLASRLEGVNKFYGTTIIISRSTYRYVQNDFVCRVLDQIAVKGKTQSETIYELLGAKGDADGEALAQFAAYFQRAYRLYTERQWDEALALFRDLQVAHPDDHVCALYVERCEHFLAQPPDESWSAVTRLTRK